MLDLIFVAFLAYIYPWVSDWYYWLIDWGTVIVSIDRYCGFGRYSYSVDIIYVG